MPGGILILYARGGGGPTTPVPSPSATLALWQELTFLNRADLWEPAETQDSDGDTQPQRWVQRYTDVPCYLAASPNVPDHPGVGQVSEHTIYTFDVRWWADGQAVDTNWVIVDKSLEPDGVTRSRNYGQAWIVQETARKTISTFLDEGHRETVSEALPPLPYSNIPAVT